MMNDLRAEQGTTVEYREIRRSRHGEKLRWLVSQEQIQDTATGQSLTRSFIRHPGICVIVPFLEDGKILLLHQYRYAVKEALWELPAGTIAGHEQYQRIVATEAPENCAARELMEETGFEASRLEKFTECYAIPGSGDELMHFFYAFELTKRKQALDIGELISEVRAFSFSEIETMIASGGIRDAKTLIGLFYRLRRKL